MHFSRKELKTYIFEKKLKKFFLSQAKGHKSQTWYTCRAWSQVCSEFFGAFYEHVYDHTQLKPLLLPSYTLGRIVQLAALNFCKHIGTMNIYNSEI